MHRLCGEPAGGVLLNRWSTGVWVGKTPTSDEHMVALPTGQVIRARAVRELDDPATMDSMRRIIAVHPHAVITMGQHNASGNAGVTPAPVVPPPRHRPDDGPEEDEQDDDEAEAPPQPEMGAKPMRGGAGWRGV